MSGPPYYSIPQDILYLLEQLAKEPRYSLAFSRWRKDIEGAKLELAPYGVTIITEWGKHYAVKKS